MVNVIDQSSPHRKVTRPHDGGVRDQSNRTVPNATHGQSPPRLKLSINARNLKRKEGGLVDRGANGGIAGRDTRVMHETTQTIDLSGVDDHTVRNLRIVTAGAVVKTQHGDVILRMNQYAYMHDAKTIHSCVQMEHFKTKVNEKAPITGADPPFIETLEGFKIPIYIENGLPYIHMRPYWDCEKEELPHVTITSDNTWDPTIADYEIEDSWYEQQDKSSEFFQQNIVDENGKLTLEGFEEERTDKFEVNRTTIKAYFHDLIRDEIHGDSEDDDEYGHEDLMRQCNDAKVTQRKSGRNKTPVDYNPKPKRSVKKKRSRNGKLTKDGVKSKKKLPDIRTKAIRKQDDEDSFEGTARTEFSNPAKSTTRDHGDIEGGPYNT